VEVEAGMVKIATGWARRDNVLRLVGTRTHVNGAMRTSRSSIGSRPWPNGYSKPNRRLTARLTLRT